MSLTLDYSGTTSALVIGTETTLATDTNNGVLTAQIDISNMAGGDVLEIRCYSQTLSGDGYQVTWKGTYANTPGPVLNVVTPPIWSDQGYRVTLKQTAGTGRTYKWKILSA